MLSNEETEPMVVSSFMETADEVITEVDKTLTTELAETESSLKSTCEKGECVPFVSCPAHINIENNQYCETSTGKKGICCCTGQNHTGRYFIY